MPRIAATPATYLDALVAARKKAKKGATVNAKELADATGITWRILEQWIVKDDGVPVLQRGDLGTPWRFDLRETVGYFVKRGRAIAKRQAETTARTAKLAGMQDVAAAPIAGDRTSQAREFKALGEAQMMAHRLKREQGEYVRRDEASAILMELMTVMQTETLAISATMDPAGQFPVEQRTAIDDHLRTVLVMLRDKVDATLARWGNGRI